MGIGGVPPTGAGYGAQGFGGAPQPAQDAAEDILAKMNDIDSLYREWMSSGDSRYLNAIQKDLAGVAKDLNLLNGMSGQLPQDAQKALSSLNGDFKSLAQALSSGDFSQVLPNIDQSLVDSMNLLKALG